MDGNERPDCRPENRVEITAAMIKEAARVLEDSGLVEYWPGAAAELIVRDMLLAALRLSVQKIR